MNNLSIDDILVDSDEKTTLKPKTKHKNKRIIQEPSVIKKSTKPISKPILEDVKNDEPILQLFKPNALDELKQEIINNQMLLMELLKLSADYQYYRKWFFKQQFKPFKVYINQANKYNKESDIEHSYIFFTSFLNHLLFEKDSKFEFSQKE